MIFHYICEVSSKVFKTPEISFILIIFSLCGAIQPLLALQAAYIALVVLYVAPFHVRVKQ